MFRFIKFNLIYFEFEYFFNKKYFSYLMGLFRGGIILLLGIVAINILDSGVLKLDKVPILGKNINKYIEKQKHYFIVIVLALVHIIL